jgi:peroxiredoxin Q/BCP
MTRSLALLLTLGLTLGAATVSAETLVPGSKAPDFELEGSDGHTRKLADYVGKRGVVLAWFPKAFTPG